MIPRTLRDGGGGAPACGGWLLVALLLLPACSTRPLIERAIRARGGPIVGLTLTSTVDVHQGAPGTWSVGRAFLAPDRYALTIVTTAEPLYELYDGSTARSFVGSAQVSTDAGTRAPLRTHARWTAVMNLDLLTSTDVQLRPLSAAELPSGAREGLQATFADGARYRLGFDARTLLVWAEGPLDLSPFGRGDVTARFGDHRPSGGRLLPFSTSYALGGVAVADERVRAACVDPPQLTSAAFHDPRLLPDCPP